MNFRRFAFRRLPRLLVYIGQDREPRYFAIKLRWDGSLRLLAKAKQARTRKSILVLDSLIPFRRLFRTSAGVRYTRNLLLATAADAFPFDIDEACFALGERDDKTYLFTIQNAELEELSVNLPPTQAVLVSASAEPESLLETLYQWLRQGDMRDMLGGLNPVAPATVLAGLLLLGAIALAATLVHGWQSRQHEVERQQQDYLAQLSTQAEPLIGKRQTIAHMLKARQSVDALKSMPGSEALQWLNEVFRAIPRGSRIDRITFADSEIRVSGWGANPDDWLPEEAGPVTVDTKVYPEEDRFKILRRLRALASDAPLPTDK